MKKRGKMMKKSDIKYSNQARLAIKQGIDQLTDVIKVTLGAKGRNVIISRQNSDPLIINDGVTIAKEINLKNHFHNIGASLCKKVAQKTNIQAGDGTTTATILAQAIVEEGQRYIMNGVNSIMLHRNLQKYGQKVLQFLKSKSKPIIKNHKINSILNIATISANNDLQIGEVIAAAIEQTGLQGVINVQNSTTEKTWLEKVDGMEIQHGFVSPYFADDPIKMETQLTDCKILLYNGKITDPKSIIDILGIVSRQGQPIIIFAQDIDGQALATLLVNRTRGILNSCAVKINIFGQRRHNILQDIAALTGGTVIQKNGTIQLKDMTEEHLGFAKKIIIDKKKTIIRQGRATEEDVSTRLKALKHLMENAQSDYEKKYYHSRIAKIIDGVSIIRIGAQTQLELKQKKLRVEDALNATKSAIEEGVIPGAGTILIHASKYLDTLKVETLEQDIAIRILKVALQSPTFNIAKNSGEKGDLIVQKVKQQTDTNIGFNALTNSLENLVQSGVIDPTKVVRCALQNAISIAGMFLTTEAIVVQSEEQNLNKMNNDIPSQMHYDE